MYNSYNSMLGLNAHLLLSGGLDPRRRARHPLDHRRPPSSLGGPHGSGHPDPDFSDRPVNTADMRAAARPAGATPLATDSTTGTGRSTDAPSVRPGTASG